MKRLLFLFATLPLVLLVACSQPAVQIVQSLGSIQAGNFSVYYQRTGFGEPLLLLHAGLQDHSMWDEQVKALSATYEVITPDLPYHGQTTGVDTNLLACDVIRILLDSLRIQQVSIAGLSLGSSIAQDFTIVYPDRVRGAIFISSGINGYNDINPIDSLSMAWFHLFNRALDRKDTAKAAREFTQAWAVGLRSSPPDSLQSEVSQYVYKTTLANLRRYKMTYWPQLQDSPFAVKQLTSIKRPVLIIDGDNDLPYISTCSGYLAQQISGAQRKTIPGVAHMLNMEKPAVFNELLLAFLKNNR